MKRLAVKPEEPSSEAVEQAVGVLRGGGLVVFPTETVYGIMADASNADTVERLYALKGRDPDKPCARLLGHTTAVLDHIPALPPIARRLAHRFWPGPLTLVVPGPDGADIGFRLPETHLPRAIASAATFPILQTSANASGSKPALDADLLPPELEEGVELVLDGGPVGGGVGSTVVRCDERAMTILREGALTEPELLDAAAQLVMVVCTGNLCRSPLGAALLAREVARRLDCEVADLPRHGFRIESCGTMAQDGLPAAEHTITVGREYDVDLSDHSSRRFGVLLLRRSRHVYCASRNHIDFLSSYFLRRPDDLKLLDPGGKPIDDPYQQGIKVHRRVAEKIAASCETRASELVAQPPVGRAR